MSRLFLKAEWRNLLMANYSIDPAVLQPHVPCHTELDFFEGVCYVSLVGFLFTDTRVFGIPFPRHTTFEEVNLRFYVRYKEGTEWKRGVVFLKEIVPKRAISFIANLLYNEKYATHKMRHQWQQSGDELAVSYHWKVGPEWNYMKATAASAAQPLQKGSAEEFITEHYWGYTLVSDVCTGVYQVAHPQWAIHPVKQYAIKCNTAELYGPAFAAALEKEPKSVFLAAGSPIKVYKGSKLSKQPIPGES